MKYFANAGVFTNIAMPAPSGANFNLIFRVQNSQGLIAKSTQEVITTPGEVRTIIANLSAPPRTLVPSPRIDEVTLERTENPVVIKLHLLGEYFRLDNIDHGLSDLGSRTDDLKIVFAIGGRDTPEGPVVAADIVLDGNWIEAGNSTDLRIVLPDDVPLGLASIILVRPMEEYDLNTREYKVVDYSSNPVQIPPQTQYVYAALGIPSEVAVIDSETTDLIAIVPVGESGGPRAVAATADGTRAYVALQHLGRIAVIDALTLREVDNDLLLEGTQQIQLPPASPFWVVADPAGRFLYVSDQSAEPGTNIGRVYVIDIDPTSKGFHTLVNMIQVDPAPLGLRGLDITPDGQKLYVAAPGTELFTSRSTTVRNGFVAVIGTDPNRTFYHEQFDAIPVGPEPYNVTTTPDPDTVLVVDRRTDARGVTIVDHGRIRTLNLVDFGLDPAKRYYQRFGVSNAEGIAYLPENAFADALGPHPAYAFITGFNRIITGDPKHDPFFDPVADAICVGGDLDCAVPPTFGGDMSPLFVRSPNGNLLVGTVNGDRVRSWSCRRWQRRHHSRSVWHRSGHRPLGGDSPHSEQFSRQSRPGRKHLVRRLPGQ